MPVTFRASLVAGFGHTFEEFGESVAVPAHEMLALCELFLVESRSGCCASDPIIERQLERPRWPPPSHQQAVESASAQHNTTDSTV